MDSLFPNIFCRYLPLCGQLGHASQEVQHAPSLHTILGKFLISGGWLSCICKFTFDLGKYSRTRRPSRSLTTQNCDLTDQCQRMIQVCIDMDILFQTISKNLAQFESHNYGDAERWSTCKIPKRHHLQSHQNFVHFDETNRLYQFYCSPLIQESNFGIRTWCNQCNNGGR
jgi:hypothetical protein